MAIWNTLKGELDKAGRAAQGALDEGKLRLEQHRAKQRAEAAAASLGFAVYRARAAGGELETERYTVLAADARERGGRSGAARARDRRTRAERGADAARLNDGSAPFDHASRASSSVTSSVQMPSMP